MRIGIDARLINQTGVGRYIRNLIEELVKIDTENEYILFFREKEFLSYIRPNNRWSARCAEIPWHTIKEQFVMPYLFSKERLDLLHIPYFNIPIFYPGCMIITIHDLIILHINTGRASTLPPMLYKLKRLAYVFILAIGLKRAKKIIAVSKATKNDIIDNFQISSNKIEVIYEGVTRNVFSSKSNTQKSKTVMANRPYILYVGNAYPHKNIKVLINMYELLNTNVKITDPNIRASSKTLQNMNLILVGPEDYFYAQYKKYVKQKNIGNLITFHGPATYEELALFYTNAEALITPSFIEGFGLPGVEAMACEIPVVASDIPVFHEIYRNAVEYFDPKDSASLIRAIFEVIMNKKKRQLLIERGTRLSQSYQWKKMVMQTHRAYESIMDR